MKNQLIITPRTKVLQLLQTYPELEEILVKTVPAFTQMQNPVLRNTVAWVTSLQHAASIGNVKVEDLINTLRQAVGQDQIREDDETHYITVKPSWFDEEGVTKGIDARSMLAAGEHPVNQVIADLSTLQIGEIYSLTTPFLPAPLIDKATSLSFKHWVDQQGEALFVVYFFKWGK